MKQKLIGFAGLAGSGKDTAAAVLVALGYRRIAFADPLKSMICTLLDIRPGVIEDRDFKETVIPYLGQSPRYLMQTLGTEWGRNLVHPDIWVQIARERIGSMLRDRDCHGVIVTDVRFRNEMQVILDLGGKVAYIDRPGITAGTTHASENSIVSSDCDLVIMNDGSVSDLHIAVMEAIS